MHARMHMEPSYSEVYPSQSSPHAAVLSHYSYVVLTQRPTVYTVLTANTEPTTCTACLAEY